MISKLVQIVYFIIERTSLERQLSYARQLLSLLLSVQNIKIPLHYAKVRIPVESNLNNTRDNS